MKKENNIQGNWFYGNNDCYSVKKPRFLVYQIIASNNSNN
jgi:predicted small secreted protein